MLQGGNTMVSGAQWWVIISWTSIQIQVVYAQCKGLSSIEWWLIIFWSSFLIWWYLPICLIPLMEKNNTQWRESRSRNLSVGASWATAMLFLQFVADICLHKLETNKIFSMNILFVVIWKSGYTFREGWAEGIEFCWGPACDVRFSWDLYCCYILWVTVHYLSSQYMHHYHLHHYIIKSIDHNLYSELLHTMHTLQHPTCLTTCLSHTITPNIPSSCQLPPQNTPFPLKMWMNCQHIHVLWINGCVGNSHYVLLYIDATVSHYLVSLSLWWQLIRSAPWMSNSAMVVSSLIRWKPEEARWVLIDLSKVWLYE